ncbi:hypothetical protein HN784_01810 [bacterium]|nr:hypothetical protein [bacterium]MBT6754201.1 hypothetical protein [bacterium]MBT7038028.1 hypothetical protein [bacterium]MBT7431560.1 hypothetical protein [bacterium]MBT7992356.1 hypothetical protein [bacterium]
MLEKNNSNNLSKERRGKVKIVKEILLISFVVILFLYGFTANAVSKEGVFESARLILSKNDLTFLFLTAGVLLCMVIYFFVFWPYQRKRLASQKSRKNIESFKLYANAILNAFTELFQGDEKLIGKIRLACMKEKLSEKSDREFQALRLVACQILNGSCNGNIERLNNFRLGGNDASSLRLMELEWLCMLSNLLGTKALSWDFERLQAVIDFLYSIDEEFFEADLCEKIHELTPSIENWQPIDLKAYKIESEALGVLDYMLKIKAIIRQCQI